MENYIWQRKSIKELKPIFEKMRDVFEDMPEMDEIELWLETFHEGDIGPVQLHEELLKWISSGSYPSLWR